MKKTFKPGEALYDTDGNRIQAHGSSVMYVDKTYYWYGENKDKTYPDSGYWYNGVNCYSSSDLYNWKFENKILKPSDDKSHPLHHSKMCDRPHILYNKTTKKYVMWIKVMGEEGFDSEDKTGAMRQFMCIAVSDTITGDFEFVKKVYPLGMFSGDFDLYADPSDGKAYIIFERVHSEMVIADLTDDYTDVTGYYSTHFPHPGPTAVREAPCLFRKEQNFYMITSGTSGYFPNKSELAHADLIHGPWTVLGVPCIEDEIGDSFNCQFSSILRVQGKKDLYIAIGDRWLDGTNVMDAAQNKYSTALAGYLWLPIIWKDNKPCIEWRDEWSLDEYEDESEINVKEQRERDAFRIEVMKAVKRQGVALPNAQ